MCERRTVLSTDFDFKKPKPFNECVLLTSQRLSRLEKIAAMLLGSSIPGQYIDHIQGRGTALSHILISSPMTCSFILVAFVLCQSVTPASDSSENGIVARAAAP